MGAQKSIRASLGAMRIKRGMQIHRFKTSKQSTKKHPGGILKSVKEVRLFETFKILFEKKKHSDVTLFISGFFEMEDDHYPSNF